MFENKKTLEKANQAIYSWGNLIIKSHGTINPHSWQCKLVDKRKSEWKGLCSSDEN